VAGYVLYRFLRRPAVTGDPKDIPPLAGEITNAIFTVGQATSKIIRRQGKKVESGTVFQVGANQGGPELNAKTTARSGGGE
jgi:hypothetical protein